MSAESIFTFNNIPNLETAVWLYGKVDASGNQVSYKADDILQVYKNKAGVYINLPSFTNNVKQTSFIKIIKKVPFINNKPTMQKVSGKELHRYNVLNIEPPAGYEFPHNALRPNQFTQNLAKQLKTKLATMPHGIPYTISRNTQIHYNAPTTPQITRANPSTALSNLINKFPGLTIKVPDVVQTRTKHKKPAITPPAKKQGGGNKTRKIKYFRKRK